jgi:hypothetical protein
LQIVVCNSWVLVAEMGFGRETSICVGEGLIISAKRVRFPSIEATNVAARIPTTTNDARIVFTIGANGTLAKWLNLR